MKTKLIIPKNIFSKIFLSELNLSNDFYVDISEAALISKKIIDDKNAIGLIPTMDLLTYKDLYVSSEIGVSFNALLSNSYIHFKDGQETVEEIFLKGDISSNEIVLSKILFKEFYDLDVKPVLIKNALPHQEDNLLIIGDENYEKELFLNGLSFAEEVIELISAPYVNFTLAGSSEEVIKNFSKNYKKNLQIGHTEKYEDLLKDLPAVSLDFISVNIQHIVFELEDQDLEGIKSLLQMPYYHGILKEILEIKFV
jgi:hypothetical protein